MITTSEYLKSVKSQSDPNNWVPNPGDYFYQITPNTFYGTIYKCLAKDDVLIYAIHFATDGKELSKVDIELTNGIFKPVGESILKAKGII